MRLLGICIILSLGSITLAEESARSLPISGRDNLRDIFAMLGFTTDQRRTELQDTIEQAERLNLDVEPIIEQIEGLLTPLRTTQVTRSKERFTLAKLTAIKHAERARKISDLSDQGIRSMQDVSDFLVKGAEFLDTLTMRAPESVELRQHLDDITKAQRNVDKLLAITVTYALRANQRAYEAEEAAKNVKAASALRNAIDYVMEAETATAQAGEIAQAIVINERIATSQAQKFAEFFVRALTETQINEPVIPVEAPPVEQLDVIRNDEIIAPPKDTAAELKAQVDDAISRLRNLKISAKIYVAAAQSAASDATDLMTFLGALGQENEKLSGIADKRKQSFEMVQRAAASAEKDFEALSYAVSAGEELAKDSSDAETMRTDLTSLEQKIADVEALMTKLRQSKDLAERKKSDIFGMIRNEFASPSEKETTS